MASKIGITDAQNYKNIANTIRKQLGLFEDDEMYAPSEMPEKINLLSEQRHAEGHESGYQEGYEKGHFDGYEEGYENSGGENAWQDGYENGWDDGYNSGWDDSSQYHYNEGYSDGQKSMVDESKIIEKTASGVNVLRLDDVSEIPHDIEVEISPNAPWKAYGKNLFEGNIDNLKTVTYANSSGGVGSRIGYEIRLPAGTYTASLVDLNSNYGDRFIYGVINNKNGEYVCTAHLMAQTASSVSPQTITLQEGDVWYIYNGIGGATMEVTQAIFESVKIQIEVGDVATPYEEYIDPVYFEGDGPDGKGAIRSLSPTLTLVALYGGSITAQYRKSFGAQKAYDEFWDTYQNKGNPKSYATAFGGVGWTNFTFKPKYDIKPTDAYMMFRQSAITGDLVAICDKAGVTLDFCYATQAIYAFTAAMNFTRIGVIDLRRMANASSANYVVMSATRLVTIDEIILPSMRLNLTDAFTGCVALQNITFSGGKIQYNINFKDSKKLTVASAKHIILMLEDFAGTSSEYLYTVSFAPETIALLEAEGNTSPSGGSWVDYITEKGWNS